MCARFLCARFFFTCLGACIAEAARGCETAGEDQVFIGGLEGVLPHDVATWKDELVLFVDDASKRADACATQATFVATFTLSCKHCAT